jgi:hypothetical protein
MPEEIAPAPAESPGAGAMTTAAHLIPPARLLMPPLRPSRWTLLYEMTLNSTLGGQNTAEARRRAEEIRELEAECRREWETSLVLLNRILTAEQATQLRNTGGFDQVSSTGRRWRIQACGQVGNVLLLGDDGQTAAVFCAHPRGVPDPAAWLAQARALAVDEAGFLAVANRQY